jgi:hypothetical protein
MGNATLIQVLPVKAAKATRHAGGDFGPGPHSDHGLPGCGRRSAP